MKKLIILIALLAGAYGVYHFVTSTTPSDEQQAQTAPEVETVTITPTNKRIWTQFSGRLEAVENVAVRPRVRGSVQKILFKEGSYVKAGQPLFVIDPRPFKAELAEANAALNAAKSAYRLSQIELNRAKKLLDMEGISQSEYDAALNQNTVNLSAIEAAKALVNSATLNVQYANIHAPVSGTVGRAEITLGNIVEDGANAPVLTTIVSTKDLFAEFDVDEATYLQAKAAGNVSNMPVEIQVNQAGIAPYKASIRSFDNQLNTQSGTIRARAYVNNHDDVLIPGLFVNIRLGSVDVQPVIEIPDNAIQTDQSKKFVYVVNDDNKVTYREVMLGNSAEGNTIVKDGLSQGDMVIVNSLQRIRPDMEVLPVAAQTARADTNL